MNKRQITFCLPDRSLEKSVILHMTRFDCFLQTGQILAALTIVSSSE